MKNLFDRIRDLKEKASKATPGGWGTVRVVHPETKEKMAEYFTEPDDCDPDGYVPLNLDSDFEDGNANRQYIATASPDLITELCTALEEARELMRRFPFKEEDPACERMRAWLEKWGKE